MSCANRAAVSVRRMQSIITRNEERKKAGEPVRIGDMIRRFTRLAGAAILVLIPVIGCVSGETDRASLTDAEKRDAIETMVQEYQRSFPEVEDLSVDRVRTMQEKGDAVLVDVRPPEERAVSMIPGAVTKEEFEAHPEDYAGKTVVTYCTIGYRSGEYAEALREKGIDAYNLEGSILSWIHDGGTVVDPEGNETHTVHVYGEKWNLLPEGYTGVW